MSVLVACEESQTLTIALRAVGVEAFSCDILPPSGGHPEWHIQGDCAPILNAGWRAVIAFPPCTDLARSGARHWPKKIADGRQAAAVEFVRAIFDCSAQYVAVENPIGALSTRWKKPTQIIHPWQFGHPESKATCLWLGGLPMLRPTNNVYNQMMALPVRERERIFYMPNTPDRAKLRSRTYSGIAEAMATQWASILHH